MGKSFTSDFEHSRQAAQTTLDKVSSYSELDAPNLEEGNKRFNEKTRELWKKFAVHGLLTFDRNEGKQVLKASTDLDGRCAMAILKESGLDIKDLTYVRPGEKVEGAINVDTGEKFGGAYDEATQTTYFDHHAPGATEITSATEITYKTMVDLGLIEKSDKLDKLTQFVTKIDNRQFPAEEFLRSAKTILGLQRDLDFDKLSAYFDDHNGPMEELTPEQFAKYGLKEAAEKQQKTVDEAMEKLKHMEQEGKVVETKYGKMLINENNELVVGAAAAYVKFDGIINITPGKSFAITLKEKTFSESELKDKLGDKFQGKIIRGQMWIYNDANPLNLSTAELIESLK